MSSAGWLKEDSLYAFIDGYVSRASRLQQSLVGWIFVRHLISGYVIILYAKCFVVA